MSLTEPAPSQVLFFSVSLPGKLESLEKCLITILIQKDMQLYLAKCFFQEKRENKIIS